MRSSNNRMLLQRNCRRRSISSTWSWFHCPKTRQRQTSKFPNGAKESNGYVLSNIFLSFLCSFHFFFSILFHCSIFFSFFWINWKNKQLIDVRCDGINSEIDGVVDRKHKVCISFILIVIFLFYFISSNCFRYLISSWIALISTLHLFAYSFTHSFTHSFIQI